jgi:endonuclease G
MALIRPDNERPLLPVEDGVFNPWVGAKDEHLAAEVADAQSTIGRVIEATGRIELTDHPELRWAGVGFLVGRGLVVTAGNVSDVICPSGRGGIVRHGPVLRLGTRLGEGAAYPIMACLNRHPVLNFAVLELATVPSEKSLVMEAGPATPGDPAAAIYAWIPGDTRNDPGWVEKLGEFDVGQKVVAPGRILGHSVDRYHDRGSWSLTHDCSTVGGAGGAPVVSLTTGRVLGCHFAGLFQQENYAAPCSEVALDPRVRALDLNFAGDLPEPDPLAFEAEYADSVGPPASEMATTRLDAHAVKWISQQLLAQHSGEVDPALEFLRNHGPAYAEAIDAQPGRDRATDQEYLEALVDSLNRRGLLSADLLDELLPAEAAPEAVTLPERTDAHLSDRTLDALTAALPERADVYVMGSPFTDQLALPDGTIEALPDIVRRLARAGDGRASEALGWMLRAIAAASDAAQIELINAALTELGQPLPELPSGLAEPDPLEMVDVSFLSSGLAAARAVVRVRFGDAGSTGWLVAPDLVVAPAHLVMLGDGGQKPWKLVSAGEVDLIACRVEFESDQPSQAVVVPVVEVAMLDFSIDLMLVRLAEKTTDRTPLQMDLSRPTRGPVAAIHYPGLGPQKLSYVGGQLIANDGHQVRYALATTGGSAGAPVFDQSWKVVATHRAWVTSVDESGREVRAKLGTSVEALIGTLRGAAQTQQLWRQICGAQEALRTIDPVLLSADSSLSQPALLVLADEMTELPAVAGLSVISDDGDSRGVLVDASAAQELAATPGVVSLTASGTAMQAECRVSLPFVGVPVDRAGIEEAGDNAIVALIDEGVDPFHHAFLDEAGTSRIDLYWDQRDGAPAHEPARTFSPAASELVGRLGIFGGTLYLGTDFGALDENTRAHLRLGVVHGTAVASIAAGRATGDDPLHFAGGLAPEAQLIVVRFDTGGKSIGASWGHQSALKMIGDRAEELGLPVVVNISNGMNAGAHDGTAELEVKCARFVDKANRSIVKSAGNETGYGRHATFEVVDRSSKVLRWQSTPKAGSAGEGTADELELWFGTYNVYEFRIQDPDGGLSTPFALNAPTSEQLGNQNSLLASYERYATTNPGRSRLSIKVQPRPKKAVQSGEWRLLITATEQRGPDTFHAWLEEQRDRVLMFKADSVEGYTITVPGTAREVITVGAVQPLLGRMLYEHSSRGPNTDEYKKPDLVAPGVGIKAARAGTDLDAMSEAESGTSFAAPHVAGAIALALSMARKSATAERPAVDLTQAQIRRLLIDSSDDFNVKGSDERGYGCLNVRTFLEAVRDHLSR